MAYCTMDKDSDVYVVRANGGGFKCHTCKMPDIPEYFSCESRTLMAEHLELHVKLGDKVPKRVLGMFKGEYDLVQREPVFDVRGGGISLSSMAVRMERIRIEGNPCAEIRLPVRRTAEIYDYSNAGVRAGRAASAPPLREEMRHIRESVAGSLRATRAQLDVNTNEPLSPEQTEDCL